MLSKKSLLLLISFVAVIGFQNCSSNFDSLSQKPITVQSQSNETIAAPQVTEGLWKGLIFANSDPVVFELEIKNNLKYSYLVSGSEFDGHGKGEIAILDNGDLKISASIIFSGSKKYEISVVNASFSPDSSELLLNTKLSNISQDGKKITTINLPLLMRRSISMKHLGLMSNDDGDNSFRANNDAISKALLEESVKRLAQSGVQSLQYNLSAGVLYYATEVGSRYAWKLTKSVPQKIDCGMSSDELDILLLANDSSAEIQQLKAQLSNMSSQQKSVFKRDWLISSWRTKFRPICKAAYGSQHCEAFNSDGTEDVSRTNSFLETWVRTCWAHNLFRAQIDPVRVAGETFLSESKKQGKESPTFFISYRISDDHFVSQPEGYPLTTEFWEKNKESLTIKRPPFNYPGLGNMLNFEKAQVRDQVVRELKEAIERYQDIANGLELDFTRTPYLFPEDEGIANVSHMTEFVARVKRQLVALEIKNKKPYYLLVRVPSTLKNSLWAGLDVEDWIKKRLIDAVIPSQIMFINNDLAVDEFHRIGKDFGVQVYASMLNRQNYGWEFRSNPGNCYTGGCSLNAAVDAHTVYGATLAALSRGANGVQLYNFASPSYLRAQWFNDMTNKLSGTSVEISKNLLSVDRVYSIAQPTTADWEGLHEPLAQLPAIVGGGKGTSFNIFLAKIPKTEGIKPILRLGLFRQSYDTRAISILVNDQILINNEKIESYSFMTNKNNSAAIETQRRSLINTVAPGSYLHIPINPNLLQEGANKVEVFVDGTTSILDLRVGLFF